MCLSYARKNLFAMLCLFLSTFCLRAQDGWRNIEFAVNGKLMTKMKAIGTNAEIGVDGQQCNVFIVLYGREGSGYINLGIVLDNIYKIVPKTEIEQFRPPDISNKIASTNALHITVYGKNVNYELSAPMIMTAALMLPASIKGNSREFFSTNIQEVNQLKWRNFLIALSNDCVKGVITVGRGFFGKPFTVEWAGIGVGPKLIDLMNSVYN